MFAADLEAVLSTLNLTDVSLVGFSMGTGEVTRYIGKYGAKRVRKAVLIGTLGPYLVKTADKMVVALQHSPVTCIYVLKELVCDRILLPARCSPTMS